jgi:hypothetical protein
MSSDHSESHLSAAAVVLNHVGKTYKRFAKPSDRFWQAVWPSTKAHEENEFVALHPLIWFKKVRPWAWWAEINNFVATGVWHPEPQQRQRGGERQNWRLA